MAPKRVYGKQKKGDDDASGDDVMDIKDTAGSFSEMVDNLSEPVAATRMSGLEFLIFALSKAYEEDLCDKHAETILYSCVKIFKSSKSVAKERKLAGDLMKLVIITSGTGLVPLYVELSESVLRVIADSSHPSVLSSLYEVVSLLTALCSEEDAPFGAVATALSESVRTQADGSCIATGCLSISLLIALSRGRDSFTTIAAACKPLARSLLNWPVEAKVAGGKLFAVLFEADAGRGNAAMPIKREFALEDVATMITGLAHERDAGKSADELKMQRSSLKSASAFIESGEPPEPIDINAGALKATLETFADFTVYEVIKSATLGAGFLTHCRENELVMELLHFEAVGPKKKLSQLEKRK